MVRTCVYAMLVCMLYVTSGTSSCSVSAQRHCESRRVEFTGEKDKFTGKIHVESYKFYSPTLTVFPLRFSRKNIKYHYSKHTRTSYCYVSFRTRAFFSRENLVYHYNGLCGKYFE